MSENKVLLSVKDLSVQFRVRGRILTAIRGISLDIYENESIAIVGESGSGKSVFTKTFAGMLDSNGFVSDGHIIFNDDELAVTKAPLTGAALKRIASVKSQLDQFSKLELGAKTWQEILSLEAEKRDKESISEEEAAQDNLKLRELRQQRADVFNHRTTLDRRKNKDEYRESTKQLNDLENQIKELEKHEEELIKAKKEAVAHDEKYLKAYEEKMAALKARHEKEIAGTVPADMLKRNEDLAREIYLSVARYDVRRRGKLTRKILKSFQNAMRVGIDWNDEAQRNALYNEITPRVKYLGEENGILNGNAVLDLANMSYAGDWTQIRGRRIATVFQDPMTSLNPIITIGKQITSVIMKHQDCTEGQAREKALDLMRKVGIPNAESRFDDYPFQYSGGMRQRIVIAIALSCQPKILICDEPTTALDVTIQAQILKLIKDLQKEFGYTIVFITHDLGVVANIADRVAVLYAGQVVELGNVEEIFYEPRHPYTWALLSSLPQLAERNTTLYSITGTPPSLYNNIIGDAFAPRNPYCMKIDTLLEPPMFQISETHYAKTWLLDPNAPQIEKPEGIRDIHGKLMSAFNI